MLDAQLRPHRDYLLAQAAGQKLFLMLTLRPGAAARQARPPLSVAFVDDGGRVINVEDMQPHTTDNHCAAGLARFALEMNLGWFAERGIKAGDTLRGFDRLPAPR